jgi:hypothetical protein
LAPTKRTAPPALQRLALTILLILFLELTMLVTLLVCHDFLLWLMKGLSPDPHAKGFPVRIQREKPGRL